MQPTIHLVRSGASSEHTRIAAVLEAAGYRVVCTDEAARPADAPTGVPLTVIVDRATDGEDEYRRLFEHMAEGFFLAEIICDEDGRPVDFRYLDANPALEPLTGLTREAIIGRTGREVLPGLEPQWIEAFGRVALTGEPASIEAYVGPLGRYYNTVAYSPRRGQFACVFNDVTARVRSEEALRAGEQRHRRFFASGMVGVVYWNTDGGITDANDKFLETVGYSREDLAAGLIDWTRMTPPEYAERDELALEELRTTGVDTPYEKEYVRKDGTRVPVIVGAAMLDDRGRDGVAFALDITERKRADEAVRRSEIALMRQRSFLRTVIDSLSSLVTVKDAEGRHLLANAAAARFYGLSVEELEGKTIGENLATPPDVSRQDQEVLRTGRETVFELDALGADGLLHSFINTRTPLANEAGVYDRVLTTAVDITWRKRAEHALREVNARAERMFSSNVVGMMIGDFSGRVIDANDYYLHLIGFSREELQAGRVRWDARTPREHRAADQRALAELRE